MEEEALENWRLIHTFQEPSRIRNHPCPSIGPGYYSRPLTSGERCMIVVHPDRQEFEGQICVRCKGKRPSNLAKVRHGLGAESLTEKGRRRLEDHLSKVCILCTREEGFICNRCAGISMWHNRNNWLNKLILPEISLISCNELTILSYSKPPRNYPTNRAKILRKV